MRVLPYRTEDNVIEVVVITFIDIAEAVIAGERVRALATTIVKTASLVMVTGQDGVIVYVNQRFAEVTGWESDAVVGRDPRFLYHGGAAAAADAELEATIASAPVWTGRLRHQRPDGRLPCEEAVAVPLRDAQGRTASRLKIASMIPGWTP